MLRNRLPPAPPPLGWPTDARGRLTLPAKTEAALLAQGRRDSASAARLAATLPPLPPFVPAEDDPEDGIPTLPAMPRCA